MRILGATLDLEGWKVTRPAAGHPHPARERAGQTLLFVSPESQDFAPAAFRGEEDASWARSYNGLDWNLRLVPAREGQLRSVVFSRPILGGITYEGYASGESEAALTDLVELFLTTIRPYDGRSLTDFFYGRNTTWVLELPERDPWAIGVKYDIAHTHDIFTKEISAQLHGHEDSWIQSGRSGTRLLEGSRTKHAE
ncbi:MAG: hypothetical protein R3B54_15175 [Bdellovibrionota bacterium]